MIKESSQLSPLEMAEQRLPFRWYESYEKIMNWTVKAMMIGSGLSAVACTASIVEGSYPWYFHFVSISIYTLSEVADRISTAKGFNAMNRASSTGILHACYEDSPLLSHVRTSKDLFYNPRSYLSSLLGITVAMVSPGLGIPLASGKVIASLNNFRIARRLNLATDIAQTEIPG